MKGEVIDRIDLNVDNAVEYVKKGEVQLTQAVKLKRKNIKVISLRLISMLMCLFYRKKLSYGVLYSL